VTPSAEAGGLDAKAVLSAKGDVVTVTVTKPETTREKTIVNQGGTKATEATENMFSAALNGSAGYEAGIPEVATEKASVGVSGRVEHVGPKRIAARSRRPRSGLVRARGRIR
jgi:hypothetical protein